MYSVNSPISLKQFKNYLFLTKSNAFQHCFNVVFQFYSFLYITVCYLFYSVFIFYVYTQVASHVLEIPRPTLSVGNCCCWTNNVLTKPAAWITREKPSFSSYCTRCFKKHGNSVTNSISSLLWINIVIPDFKSLNIIMPARVYFIKSSKDCEDVSSLRQMNCEDEQVYCVCILQFCILQFSYFAKHNRMQSKHKQTKCEHSRRNPCVLQLS